MAVPSTNASKKNAARSMVVRSDYLDGLIAAYSAVNASSYSNKATALSDLDALYDAVNSAITSIENLA